MYPFKGALVALFYCLVLSSSVSKATPGEHKYVHPWGYRANYVSCHGHATKYNVCSVSQPIGTKTWSIPTNLV